MPYDDIKIPTRPTGQRVCYSWCAAGPSRWPSKLTNLLNSDPHWKWAFINMHCVYISWTNDEGQGVPGDEVLLHPGDDNLKPPQNPKIQKHSGHKPDLCNLLLHIIKNIGQNILVTEYFLISNFAVLNLLQPKC